MTAEGEASLSEQLRQDLAAQLSDIDLDWTYQTSAGDAAATLERVAVDQRADLIVVGP